MKITILAVLVCISYIISDVSAKPMNIELQMELFKRKFADENVGDRNAAKLVRRFLKVKHGSRKMKTVTSVLRLMAIMEKIDSELMENEAEMPLKCNYGTPGKKTSQITFDSFTLFHDASQRLGHILQEVMNKPMRRVMRQASRKNSVDVDGKLAQELHKNLHQIACEVLNLRSTKLFNTMRKLYSTRK